MESDLSTTDSGTKHLTSFEDGTGNSSGDDGIDGGGSDDSVDYDDSVDCDDSDGSDGEDMISFCRGIDETTPPTALVDENNSLHPMVVENNPEEAAQAENNFEKELNNSRRRELVVQDGFDPRTVADEIGDDEEATKKENLRLMCEAIEQRLSVGSTLQDLEQAYLIYCEYGRLKGFGVRRGEQRYHCQTAEVKWKEYVCCCTGVTDSKCSNRRVPPFKKLLTRTGCRAKIRVSRQLGSDWQVSIFDTEHNHVLVPAEQTYMLRSSRNLSYAQASILEALHSAGIGVTRACGFMEKECGGPQNLGFTRRDAYDHFVRKGRKSKLKNGDSKLLHDYFIEKSEEDPYFYWNSEKDEEGRLMNFFFRDGRSLLDYEAFSEVLSVDTTFSTNKYNLICAPFVGINHHTFTCMFGIGFLSDETTPSFEWLFREFLRSMKGRQPKVVFTDQCVAMMNAIQTIFTDSKPRLCQWHVNRNATKRFGSLNKNSEFKKLWHQCMNEVETEGEFDRLWERLLTFTNPKGKNQNWFKAMHKLRHRWASVFTRGIFTAGLLATSRSEGANRCVKSGKRRTATLIEFVENYEALKLKWRTRETEQDTLGIWMPGQVVSSNELFTQAASTYTRKVYDIFEHEAVRIWDVKLPHEQVDLGDDDVELTVTTLTHGRDRKIVYNKKTQCARCSCRMWESEGVLCRHILRVYHFMNNYKIPESQILKRWTKTAKCGSLIQSVRSDKSGVLPNMLFVNIILRRVYEIACTCLEREDCRSVVKERVEALGKEIYNMTGLPQVKTKRKAVADDGNDNDNVEKARPFTDPKSILERGFVHARACRTSNAAKKKGMDATNKAQRASSDTPKGNKKPVPPTPDNTTSKSRARSSVPRVPYQMSEHTSGIRNLYEHHSAGLIPQRSKFRSLSQP